MTEATPFKPKDDNVDHSQSLLDWPAYLERDLMEEIESDCQNHSHGVNRRCLLAILTMDSEKVFEACEESPEAFFDAFRSSASTLSMYKRLVKIMNVGHNRLMLGLCAVDTDAPDAPFSKKEFFDAIDQAKDEAVTDEEMQAAEKTDN